MTFTTASVILCCKSFDAYRGNEVSYAKHIVAEFFINESTICEAMKCTILMLFTETYYVFLPYKRLTTCHKICMNAKLFALLDDAIHIFK
ncbi:hypothetical protein SDC9_120108 [bioreactor metagenome]|uniref:Uncharacterized protein n=1 Tax=bioreactor metagenome TaxID=1076179 RepID=A0A645C632_9ZZZZ